jgi:TatA/E family protein of Tat protein translocase
MFGPLGFPELIFILVLALLIFGPKKLPEIGRTLGKGLAEFRRATDDLKRTINTEVALEEEKTRRPQPHLALPADRTAALHGVVPAAGAAAAGAAAAGTPAEEAPAAAAASDASDPAAAGETASPAPADPPSGVPETEAAAEAAGATAETGAETPAEAAPAGDAAATT